MNNQLEQARTEFLATVTAFPADAEAKFDVVRFLNTTQSPQAGMAQLDQFIAAEPNNHEFRFFQAAMHSAAGNRDGASAAYREIIARAGDAEAGTRARAVLAGEALAANDRQTGRTLIEEILSRDARNEAGLLLRAGIAIDEQRLDDAVADLRTVLRDSPNSARAHTLLGKAHELQGANDLALDHYGRGHQAGRGQGPQFGMALAEFLLKTGRDRQIEAVLRDVLTHNPGHVPALRLLAQAYINTGDLASAQFVADELAKIEGQTVAVSQIQGAVFVARQNFDSAIGALRRAHDFAPTELQPMVTLVQGYMVAGRERDALNFMQSVVNVSPNNVDARLLLAQLRQQTGDSAGARQAFEAVLAINPRAVPAYLGLMNLSVAEGRMADADAWLAKGLQATDNDFNLRLARASVLENLSRYEEAIALYETLLQDRPGMDVVINNLASLLTDHRTDRASHDRAYQLAQRFRNSQVPQFRDTLGWASFKVGRMEDAVLLLRSAVDALPDVAVVHYHYGMVQLAQNNRVIAREALERAVALGESQPFSQLDRARQALASL
jgi:tetratricopeptide (TPR) repeat protein